MEKIIKTGICSYGLSGKIFHAPFLQNHPGFALQAIVERHKNESKEKYPDAQVYRSITEMLADNSLQLIIVNTPVQTHHEYTKAALLAGKHVITEKPFTVNAKEAEELAALANEKKLLLSVYQNRRYDGDYVAVKKCVQEKWLGKITETEIRFDRYVPVAKGKIHKEGNLPGAGILHDLGAHLIDQALQLFGLPEQIFADIQIMRKEQVVANDYFELILFYPALRVRVKANMLARLSTSAYTLHGCNGSFVQQRSDLQEQKLNEGFAPSLLDWCPSATASDNILHTIINKETIYKESIAGSGNYMKYFDDIHKSLTGNGKNPIPASDGVLTMKIIDAAFLSHQLGEKINL